MHFIGPSRHCPLAQSASVVHAASVSNPHLPGGLVAQWPDAQSVLAEQF
jgi:hypothetical protein